MASPAASHLDIGAELSSGRGLVAVIEGEPGIGKTTLAEQALERLPQGAKVVRVRCVPARLSPLYELVEGLGSAGLGVLVADRPPKLEALYVMAPSGLLAARVQRSEGLDADIFSGMLTAVRQFVADSMRASALSRLDADPFKILILAAGGSQLVAIFSGSENEFLRDDLEELASRIAERFGAALDSWDGTESAVAGLAGEVSALLESGRYEGLEEAADEPKLKRERLYGNIVRGLRREAQRGGLVLFVDDAQWADEGTVALLQPLGLATREERMAILLTVRPGEAPDYLVTGVQRLSREAKVVKVELSRRDAGEIARILESRIGPFDPELAERIRDEGQGNPLYCLEIGRYLQERGMLEQGPRGRRAREGATFEIPSKARDLILARISTLGPGERRTLDLASVLGEQFETKVVAQALGPAAVSSLDEIERRHRLLRRSSSGLEFDHAWTRDAVYESVGESRRAQLHAQAAQALEAVHGNDEKRAAEVAEHWRLAGERDRAREQFRRAARLAASRYENEAAAAALRSALALAPEAETEAILEELVRVLEAAGKYEECEDAYSRLVEIAESSGEFRKAAEFKTRRGTILSERRFAHDKAAEQFDSAATLFEMEGDGVGVAKVDAARGSMAYLTGRLADAEALLDRALARGMELGMSPVDLAHSKNRLAAVMYKTGRAAEALALLGDCVRIFREAKMEYRVAVMHHNMALIHKERGELDKANETLNVSLKMAEKSGSLSGAGLARLTRSLVSFARERFREAKEDAERAAALFRITGEPGGEWKAEEAAADAAAQLGEVGAGLERCRRAVEAARRTASPRDQASVLITLGRLCAMAGDREGADQAFRESGELSAREKGATERKKLLLAMGEHLATSGDGARLGEALIGLEEVRSTLSAAEAAKADLLKASAAEIGGRLEEAIALAEASRRRFEELRMPVSAARASDLAARLAARAATG